ncbi:MAG: alternative ribosome rescue aminoacyl-tRNA hydrolase ArfB [Pseudomonadota bacterium]
MIKISETLDIAEWEISESFMRASGPGGQHVNKSDTAVELRFEAQRSPHLPPYIKANLKKIAGRKWTKDGAIVIQADTHRQQSRNRQEALDRLIDMIQRAAKRQKRRIKTKPSRAARARRMDQKKQRGDIKKLRQKPIE